MVAHVTTVAFLGLEARRVDVQVQVAKSGMNAFNIVGLPDNESKERVRAALLAIGLELPLHRITVNLSPVGLPKEGSHFDLAIALGLLAAIGVVDAEDLSQYVAIGELSLDGRLAPVPGVLLAALHALENDLGLICPASQSGEAALAGRIEVLAAPDILSLLNHLKGVQLLRRPERAVAETGWHGPDLAEVKGQQNAKRALEIAAAGAHSLLMVGPPGAGRSLLAACLPGILPDLTPKEALEVSMVASVAGELEGGRLPRKRPYRAPHHSASMPALVGGGMRARPGEVSLAHRGVLFLDELPDFQRPVLDSLRQPLETGNIVVARASAHVSYPSRIQLVAAMSPCTCGHLGDGALACSRAPKCAADYQTRVPGPLLERIDLHVDLEPVPAAGLTLPPAETSAGVAARVAAARSVQDARYANHAGVRTNAEADGKLLEAVAMPDEPGRKLLAQAAEAMRFSALDYHRVLRLSRTLADLAGAEAVGRVHVAEALSYRRRARVN